MFIVAFHGWQTQLSAHEEFFTSTELLDLPCYGTLFGRIMDAANVGAEAGRVRVLGHWNQDLDIVGRGAAFELRSSLQP